MQVNRSAAVEFTADTGQYTQSLTQAINITNQYANAADTLLGKIAKFGGTLSASIVNRTASLTQANKVATAQAAAYQQKLSGLEATAAVLGTKTFPKLEKATKDLAKAYPIGIGQAVDQMKALQESGVTQVAQTQKLAKAYTQLGAATSSYGPETGRAMTELTRSMGNSLEMVTGMNDSLVTLTKTYGGTAGGVLAFSKSIAPIAATVGMNQTQVMGLSTAFNRLGENGFAAGNALNKVMIDLNRSVQDGTPELRIYADVMNKSMESLRTQFTTDPASVLVDFTEAISKQGPEAIRVLDSLGLEGVRTVKALTSLSREGNLGQIINDASGAFGSGSAGLAAETAMGGVNDQVTRLNETMSQMVAGAGKPFLGFLEGVLKLSNDVAGGFNEIVNSPFFQQIGKVGQIAGGAGQMLGGAAINAVGAASTIAFGRRLFTGGSRMMGDYRIGRMEGMAGNAGMRFYAGDTGMAGSLGRTIAERTGAGRGMDMASLALMASSFGPGGVKAGQSAAQAVKGWVGGKGNQIKDLTSLLMLSTASDMNTAFGKGGISTEGGAYLREQVGRAKVLHQAGQTGDALKLVSASLKDVADVSAKTGVAFGGLRTSIIDLLASTTMVLGTTGKAGLSKLGSFIGPGAATAAVVGTAAYAGYKLDQEKKAQTAAVAATEGFGRFNEFAEKTGYATRSISMLGEASEKAAKQILAEENKNEDDWKTLTMREIRMTQDPGYAPGFITGTAGAKQDAMSAFLMNPTASADVLSRQVADVFKQKDQAYTNTFVAELDALRKSNEEVGITLTDLVKGADVGRPTTGTFGWFNKMLNDVFEGQPSGQEKQREVEIADYVRQQRIRDNETLTPDAAAANASRRYEEIFNAGKTSRAAAMNASSILAGLTGIDPTTLQDAMSKNVRLSKSWDELMASQKGNTSAAGAVSDWEKAKSGATGTLTPAENEGYKRQKKSDETVEKVIGVNTKLADTMFEGNKLSLDLGKSINELTDMEKKRLSTTGQAVLEAKLTPYDPQKVMAAGIALANDMMAKTGSERQAELALRNAKATTTDIGEQNALASALQMLKISPAVVQRRTSMSTVQGLQESMRAGVEARQAGLPENATAEDAAAYQTKLAEASQSYEAYKELVKQTAIQVRDASISMRRSEEDYATSVRRQKRDFGRQMAYMEADHNHQVKIANRNFKQSQLWAEKDYNLQVTYAKADHNKADRRAQEDYQRQVERNTYDFRTQMLRGEQDFAKQTARAKEDYAKQVLRSEQDYQRQVMRAQRDFAIQRNRAIADYDKALARQIEDNAKSIYDPYTRIMHQRVQSAGQLARNMAEQNKMIERQMKAIEEMKAAGLSQSAVDMLDLANPEKAQQALKLNTDMQQNPNAVAEMNAAATERSRLSGQFTTSANNVDTRRQAEDFALSMSRSSEDFSKSMDDAATDFATSLARGAEDFTKSMARSQEDYATSVNRAIDDFHMGMSRMAEDLALSLERSDEDLKTGLKRMEKAYETSMARAKKLHDQQMAEVEREYGLQVERQRKAFNTAMSDAMADFTLQKERAVADLVLAMEDVNTGFMALVEQGLVDIGMLPDKYRKPLMDAFQTILDGFSEQEKTWIDEQPGLRFKYYDPSTGKYIDGGPITIPIKFTAEQIQADIDIRSSHSKEEHSDKGGQGLGASGGGSADLAKHFEDAVGDSSITGKVGNTVTKRPVYKRCLANVRNAKHYLGDGIHHWQSAAALVGGALEREGKLNSGYGAPKGALFWWSDKIGGGYGHVAVSDGKGNAINNWGGPTVEKLSVKSMAPGAYMGWSSYAALATGGIMTKPTMALMAEAGSSEMAIPLNERGVRYLLDVMERYRMSNDEARTARVAPYSTNVSYYSYSYDQSTRITGPITVEAADLSGFTRQLQSKARRDKILQPVGGPK